MKIDASGGPTQTSAANSISPLTARTYGSKRKPPSSSAV